MTKQKLVVQEAAIHTASFWVLIGFNTVLGFKGTVLSGQMFSNKIVWGFQLHEVLENVHLLSAERFLLSAFPPARPLPPQKNTVIKE